MQKIALDIIIIPSQDTMEEVISVSKNLSGAGTRFLLNLTDFIPHISLAMGVVEMQSIETIEKQLYELSLDCLEFELSVDHIYNSIQKSGENITGWGLSNPERLQKLHEDC